MSHALSPVPGVSTPVTVPDNGDSANADPIIAVVQEFDNRTTLIRQPAMSASARYPLAARSLTRVMQHLWIPEAPASWTRQSNLPQLLYTTSTSGLIAQLPLSIPHGATVANITVALRGGGHGAMPATKPTAIISSWTATTGGTAYSTESSSTTDPSTTVAAYDGWHPLTIPWTGGIIDNASKLYVLILTSESGTNAVAGMALGIVTATFMTSAQDDGAA